MAKLNSNDYVLFVDDTTPLTADSGEAYEVVACITTAGLTGTTAVIEVNDRCGNDALPGNSTNTLTGTGNATTEDLTPSVASYEKLLSIYQSKKKVWMKIGNAPGGTPGAPVVIREVKGFITDYSETADQDTPYTFSFTLRADGDINTAVIP